MERGEIRKSLKVFLDSPMAISATRIFGRHPEALRPEIAAMIRSGRDPFDLPELHFTGDAHDSMALNRIRSGAVIMAGSGMCTGGRVRHHLRYNLAHSDCSVIFVGYAAAGTLARIIIDGAREVQLFGDRIPVKAKIHTINGFSAHAGASGLKEWHARTGAPSRTFLVHGETQALEAFARTLGTASVEIPHLHQSYRL
jgi:metallo-beta-lactamase family protein